MAEPARKHKEIEPDIRPHFGVVEGGGQSTPDRANLRGLEKQESNPKKPNTGSIAEQEADGSNVTKGPWEDSTTGNPKSIGFIGSAKKKSASIAIALTLIGLAFVGIGGVAGPSMLLVHIKETLVGSLNDSGAALDVRTNNILRLKLKTVKGGFAESSPGKCNITCKFSTVNDTMVANLKAKGFTVETKDGQGAFKDRHTITSLTFPNGTKVTDGKSFDKEMNKAANAVAFKKVFNSKTAYFLNSKFGQILSNKFHLDKLSKLKSSAIDAVKGKAKSIKDSITSSIHSALGIPEPDPNAPKAPTFSEKLAADPRMQPVSAAIGKLSGISNKVSDAIGFVCTTYDTTRGITLATKVAKIAAFAGFAMMFLNAADQIKAGEADPDVISQLGGQLTQLDANGKSATDSLGYQAAAYGGTGTLTAEDQTYSASASTNVFNVIGTLMGALMLGKILGTVLAKNICKTSNNAGVALGQNVAEIIAECPEAVAVAATTGAETLGVGALLSAGECVGKKVAKDWFMQAAVGFAIGKAATSLIEAIVNGDTPKLDETTNGTALGDSLYTGSAQILGGTSASYGLKAGTKAEIKQYAIDTANIRQQEANIASYDARNTPFDIYNQYSFIGSIANTVGIGAIYNSSSPLSYIGNILSIIPRSFGTLSNNVGAAADSKANQYGQCTDVAIVSMGIAADAFCNPSYVMSSGEMNADVATVTDYMIKNGYIDENTGDPIVATGQHADLLSGAMVNNTNDYQLYLDNCVNRVEPLGETSTSVSDDTYEWSVGIKCTENSDILSNFRTYTMDKSISDTMDEDPNAPVDNGPSSGGTPAGDDSQPDNTTKLGSGWTLKDGADYSGVACAAGTKDKGDYKHPIRKFTIRLCDTVLGEVSSLISQKVVDMVAAAKKDGYSLTGSGWRSYETQLGIWKKDGCSGDCGGMVARPGNSNHERGIAIDFHNSSGGKLKVGDPIHIWLDKNGPKFGFYNYPKEAWHYSMDGH